MAIALAAAISLVSGYLLVTAGWPRSRETLTIWIMKVSLATGFGLGISSVTLFLERMLQTGKFVAIDLAVLVALGVLSFLIRASASNNATSEVVTDLSIPHWQQLALIPCFSFAIAAAANNAVTSVFANPHGNGWDSFAIWNLHARFLFRGGSHWRDGFNALIPWSHADYPLLLPAAVARFWAYLGCDSPAVPAILGLIFTLSTLTLLVSSVSYLRGRNAALLAGIALAASPFFVEQATAQYADIPLSFFILSSIVLLHFGFQLRSKENLRESGGSWVLAGVSAGFAAWTKNEGLLFLAAMFASYFWVFGHTQKSTVEPSTLPQPRWDILFPVLVGAAPILAIVAWFKYSIATSGDLFSSPSVMLEKVLNLGRYGAILRWYARELFRFGEWWILPGTVLLAVFYFLARQKDRAPRDPVFRASLCTLGFTLAGYFFIYLITPRDLYWHLRFSLNRLFLQLWPTTIFLFFLSTGSDAPLLSQNELEIARKP